MKKRKNFLWAIVIIIGVLQGCNIFIINKEIKFSKSELKTWGNSDEITQGNYILVQKNNGIWSFPFAFGESLFLYNIETKRWSLVRKCINPYNTTGNKLTIQGGNIYYNMFGAEEGIEIFRKKNGSLEEKKIANQAGRYSVSEKEMYYIIDDEAIEDKGHYDENSLYKLDLKSGKKKLILKGSMSNVLREDHGKLYCYDIQKKSVLEISLQKKEITYGENFSEVGWIGYLNDDEFLVIADDTLVKYNKRKKQKKMITKIIGLQNGNVILKNGSLYYMNMEGNLYRVNITDGSQKKMISVVETEKIKNDKEIETTVNYSKDYIVIDTYLNLDKKNEQRKLLIFNYDGEKTGEELLR